MPLESLEYRISTLQFEKITVLGSGNFGKVILYKYEGEDPKVQSLCDKFGRIAIKLSEPLSDQEVLIAQHIAKSQRENPKINLSDVNIISTIKEQDEIIGILTQYECYTNSTQGHIHETSANLETFLRNTFNSRGIAFQTGPEIRSAMKQNYGIFMGQIASSMYRAQSQLHQLSLLHLDTATRNFLINTDVDDMGNLMRIRVKISDYGQSCVLPPGEQFGTFINPEQTPLKWIDYQGLWKRKPSILTDLFAQKTSIIGMIGLTLIDCNKEGEILKRPPISPNQTDKEVLTHYLHYIKYLAGQQFSWQKKQELERFISCYEEYLTTMPDTADFWAAQEQDRQLFLKANTRFVAQCYQQLVKEQAHPEELLVSLQRLQYIEINDAELQNVIQNQIEQLNIQLGKQIPPSTEVSPLKEDASNIRRQQFIERSYTRRNSADVEPQLKTELGRIVADIHLMKDAYKACEGILKGKHRHDIDVLIAKVEEIVATKYSSAEQLLQITELLKEDYKKAKKEYSPSFLTRDRSFLNDVNLVKDSHHYSRMLGLILANLFAMPELPEKLKHKDLNIISEVNQIVLPNNQQEYSRFSFMSPSKVTSEDKENIQPH